MDTNMNDIMRWWGKAMVERAEARGLCAKYYRENQRLAEALKAANDDADRLAGVLQVLDADIQEGVVFEGDTSALKVLDLHRKRVTK